MNRQLSIQPAIKAEPSAIFVWVPFDFGSSLHGASRLPRTRCPESCASQSNGQRHHVGLKAHCMSANQQLQPAGRHTRWAVNELDTVLSD